MKNEKRNIWIFEQSWSRKNIINVNVLGPTCDEGLISSLCFWFLSNSYARLLSILSYITRSWEDPVIQVELDHLFEYRKGKAHGRHLVLFYVSIGLHPLQAGVTSDLRLIVDILGPPFWEWITDRTYWHRNIATLLCLLSPIANMTQPLIEIRIWKPKRNSSPIDTTCSCEKINLFIARKYLPEPYFIPQSHNHSKEECIANYCKSNNNQFGVYPQQVSFLFFLSWKHFQNMSVLEYPISWVLNFSIRET